MGESLEARYIAVERAYGEGRFTAALDQALALVPQLEPGRDDQLGLRLQLLIGHIHGYGLQQPAEAAAAYRLVLQQSTDPEYQALAQQGLEQWAAQQPATPWLSQLADAAAPPPDQLQSPCGRNPSNAHPRPTSSASESATNSASDNPPFSAEEWADYARGWLLVDLNSQPQTRR